MLRFAAMLLILAPVCAEAQIIITVPVPAPVVPSRFVAPVPPPLSGELEAHDLRRGMFRRWGGRMRARREMHREMAARYGYGWPTIGVPVPVPAPFSNDESKRDEPQLEIEIPEEGANVEPFAPREPIPAPAPNDLPAPAPAPAPAAAPAPAPKGPPLPTPSVNSTAPILPAPSLTPALAPKAGPQKF